MVPALNSGNGTRCLLFAAQINSIRDVKPCPTASGGIQALRLVDSQRKWELDKRYFISATEALALPLRLYQLIEETTMDPHTRNALVIGLENEVLRFQRGNHAPMLVDGNRK